MNSDYISTVITAAIAIVTLYVNYRISSVKNQIDGRVATATKEAEFRDDLMNMVKAQETRINDQDKVITVLKESVISLKEENSDLRREKRDNERELAELRELLARVEKRVYYTPGEQK